MDKKEKLKKQYKNIKSDYMDTHRFSFIHGSKNKMFDFVVYSTYYDEYVKLLKPQEKISRDEFLSYMRALQELRPLIRMKYTLYYLSEDIEVENKETIELKELVKSYNRD